MTASLRRNLSLRLSAVALAPVLAVASVLWFFLFPHLESRVTEAHSSLSASLSRETERYLNTPLKMLGSIAQGVLTGELDNASLPATLDAAVKGSDIFDAIYLLDLYGKVAYIGLPDNNNRSKAAFRGLDLSASQIFRTLESGQATAWSPVFLSAISEQPTVAVAVRIGNRVLAGEIGLHRLSDFVRRAAARESLRIVIVDRYGQILAHPQPEQARQLPNIGNLPILRQALASPGESITATFPFGSESVIGTVTQDPKLGWFTMVMEPLSLARKPLLDSIMALISIGAVATFFAVMVGLVMTGRLSSRFEHLSETAASIANGHYPEEWPASDIQEEEQLLSSLHRMADAVRDREHSLRTLNQELESRVEVRTAELKRINHELTNAMSSLTTAQDELVRSEKMAALGNLVAGVAHELNTPIGNSLMVATTLDDKTKEFGKRIETGLSKSYLLAYLEASREASSVLIRNLIRAADLIASFKQVAVDQTTSQRRPFPLDEVVHEIAVTLSPTLKKTPYQLDINIPPGIQMDSFPGPLGQVIANLVNNAVLHAFEGLNQGQIMIKAELREGSQVTITVSDNGRGIPPDHLSRIFDPFFTTKMGQGGTGLGLSICHNLVTHILGGQLHVTSEPGSGTTFGITIPLIAPEKAVSD